MIKNDILEKAKEDKIEYVNFQFSDIHGFIKSFEKPISKLEEALTDGLWFDGSSVDGISRIKESDMFLVPDIDTYRVIPWDKRVARIICDINTPEGEPFLSDPRSVLKKVVAKAKGLGFEYYVGPELEFFLGSLEDGVYIPHDTAGYFDQVHDKGKKIRREMMDIIQQFGIKGDSEHHEVAPGQHEICIDYGKAVDIADAVLTIKWVVKEIANNNSLIATFMPKPIYGMNGSGMHVHQSFFKDGKNAFFDKDDRYNISKIAYNFIGGQLEHARGLSSIVAPTVNSYKRLVPGYEAPVYICWAQQNRSALIRIPRYKAGKEKSTRLELRCPDPSSNPYLAFAAMLSAGLDGMKKDISPPKPVEEDVYHFTETELKERGIGYLPQSLMSALKDLSDDKVIINGLGKGLADKYIAAKTKEWDDFRVTVSRWETERYLVNY